MKNALTIFIFAVIALAVFIPSYTQLQDLRTKNKDLEDKIIVLTQKNGELREEKRRLIEDPVYLEKVARERLGIGRKGEVVYRLVPESGAAD